MQSFIGTLYGSSDRAAVVGALDEDAAPWQGEVQLPHDMQGWMASESRFVLRLSDGREAPIRVRTCDVSGGRITFRGEAPLALHDGALETPLR